VKESDIIRAKRLMDEREEINKKLKDIDDTAYIDFFTGNDKTITFSEITGPNGVTKELIGVARLCLGARLEDIEKSLKELEVEP